MNPKPKRYNWRVSEEVASELTRRMRVAGMKSWDDFFQAMLVRWDAVPGLGPTPSSKTLEGIRSILREELDVRQISNEPLLRELEKLEAQNGLLERLITRFSQFVDWLIQPKKEKEDEAVPSGPMSALQRRIRQRTAGYDE